MMYPERALLSFFHPRIFCGQPVSTWPENAFGREIAV